MKTQVSVLAITALGAAASMFAPAAQACGFPDIVGGRISQSQLAVTRMQARQVSHALSSMQRVSARPASRPSRSIVGMWHFTYVSLGNGDMGIPDGTVLDDGYQTWHGDGTEITNSGRPPMTQSFCTGVWDRSGGDYRLNHFALSWDPTGTQFVGPTNIREMVSVDTSGNAIEGEFTIDQYSPDGSTVVAHLGGTMSGQRVTVD